MVDAFVHPDKPEDFMAVGCYYSVFPQVAEAEAVLFLDDLRERVAA